MAKNGYQHMVLDDYVRRVRQIYRKRDARLSQVATRRQAEAYRRQVRGIIHRAFSPRPPQTPLDARVTGALDLPACCGRQVRVEKVTFESRPGCLVTANLYIPHDLTEPAPCVLGVCGHSEQGKACDLYQGFCQRLACTGFVVLIYDPFSQGERDQYYGLSDREQVAWCTRAHNMMGKQLELVGEFFGMWRAWDGIRALDYLLSRPEVDPTRVGLTGNSGGGTMTTWLWAIEDRFTMAAPGCFVTTFLHNLENELPADCEQCPPGVLGAGLEMADFLIAGAPKPLLLLGQTYDFFDRRGLREAYQDVSRFYALLGAPEENVSLFVGPQGHGYSVHNQRAMVEFFARHAGLPTVHVAETEPLDEGTLAATPPGNVIAAGATPIYELIAAHAQTLEAKRPPLDDKALEAELRRLLALPDSRMSDDGTSSDVPSSVPFLPPFRILRPVHKGNEVFARYAIETEGHVRAILWKWLSQPDHPYSLDVEPEVHLYLPHVSSEVDLAGEGVGERVRQALLLDGSLPLYALDVRGLGESLPEEEGGFFQPYGMDYMFHAYGLMLEQSYLGRRVYDVLRTIDLLANEEVEAVHLYGRGQGAILALFAALFHRRVASVTLKNGPSSFIEWTQTPLVAWPAANFLRGVLAVCDLPDCVRLLRSRLSADKVRIIEPWGPDMRDMQ